MKKTKIRGVSKLKTCLKWFDSYIESRYEDKRKTFLFLAFFIASILFLLQMGIIIINNSFYNNFSDDIIQYYSIIVDFIEQLKAGTISWFNLNNYFGASLFSDVYYVPIDVFTGITFLLSYVMPTELAYSSTELIKIWSGVMIFAYYLSMQGMKNRTIFWMGVVYFISGGMISYMAFPVFLSMIFYLPLGLVVIHWYFRKKAWVVPLYVLALIFYDFYLGYTALTFVSVMFVVEYFKQPEFRFWKFLGNGAGFLGLLLIGVAMSGLILYPSILFILEDTYRPVGSFDAWLVSIGPIDLKLFQPTIYVRILAKMFAEQKPIGFYGFENNYGVEHFSLFITIVGIVYMNYIWFMKGRIARVYKIAIPIAFLMMLFPIFSYVFSGTADSPYTRWINMIPLVQVMILAHVFDEYGFEKVKMKLLTIPIVVLAATLTFVLIYYFIKLGTDEHFVSRDVMTADVVFMCIGGVVLLLIVLVGWLKKFQWIRTLFWFEFVLAIGYAYSGPFAIRNKIDTFESMYSINHFLEANLEKDQFYRVYVDLNRFDVEKLNFNRMTTFPTNTEIFHSWTDAETNAIGYLLFNTNEYQSKDKMSVQAIYLNHVLGYKYVLLNAEENYTLESEYYTLISEDAQYRLYEIKDSEGFQVYENYTSYEYFHTFANGNTKIAAQKLMMLYALIDEERYLDKTYNLERSEPVVFADQDTLSSMQTNSDAVLINHPTNGKLYYRYGVGGWDIDFEQGAIYIKSNFLTTQSYGDVYMVFADNSTRACEVVADQTHQVKCEFWKEPQAIYFEKTPSFNSIKAMQYRMERAIDGAAYLVYDFNDAINENNGMLSFSLNSMTFDRVFAVDAFGNETECFEGYYYFDEAPKRLYIYKTNDMYQYSNLFLLSLRYIYDDLTYYDQTAASDLATNQLITIEKGVIRLSYTRTSLSTYDQLVMIPVAYSEEWIVENGDYETMAVSGGFLGILIPNGVMEIDLVLRFHPKGVGHGALISAGGLFLYSAIFIPIYLVRKHRKNTIVTEVILDEETNSHSTIV